MRKLAHIAILPLIFMLFTEVEIGNRPELDHPVILGIDSDVEIIPNELGRRGIDARIKTTIRLKNGRIHNVTTPFEKIQSELAGSVGLTDMREPAPATPALPACAPAPTCVPVTPNTGTFR